MPDSERMYTFIHLARMRLTAVVVQKWMSILLAVFGGATLIGSRKWFPLKSTLDEHATKITSHPWVFGRQGSFAKDSFCFRFTGGRGIDGDVLDGTVSSTAGHRPLSPGAFDGGSVDCRKCPDH